jgi:hypothetical protein
MAYTVIMAKSIDRYVFSANFLQFHSIDISDCIQRETWCIGPCAGVDYTITSPYSMSTPESSPKHVPWALGITMPESTLTLCQSRHYPPVKD